MSNQSKSVHWADIYADKIVREKGEKEVYTCASGITPSGTVHIGNFREMISVDLVVRALRDKGKQVRFIYSWDDYDVFRKVPKNMKDPELLATFLRKPITSVPDTNGNWDNYAMANEKAVEALLPVVGIVPEYLHQASRYQDGTYARGMKRALERKEEIKEILNAFRSEPLGDDWFPVSVFSGFTGKDTTTVLSWDGDWKITYKDDETGQEETVDLRETKIAKLPWRIDWPMRWAHEGVDFEPAGKDHHSEGGSFDTSKDIVRLFDGTPPVSFQYDFISIKGRGGKISSSSGEVVSLPDVLEVYTPEVTRYLFAGTRPNTEFSISFDLDVLKIYEDYDSCERIYFGITEVNEKRKIKEKRIYELSQVDGIPPCASYQIPFRHLCNLLQVHEGDAAALITSLGDVLPEQEERLTQRCICAYRWITTFSPEDFRWNLSREGEELITLNETQYKAIHELTDAVKRLDDFTEKEFSEEIYRIAHLYEIHPPEFFAVCYQILIHKEKGPKLAGFIKTIGKEKVLPILERY